MKIAVIFSRHAEALLNKNSKRTYGGGEIQMYNIAKEFGKHVETFSLIQDYENIDFDEKEKFNFVKTFKDSDNLLTKFFKITKAISKVNPDVLIQRGVTPYSYFLAKYCNLRKIKFVLMFGHDIEADGVYQSSLKKCHTFKLLLRSSDKLIVQNSLQKEKTVGFNRETYILKKGLDFKPLKISSLLKKYDGLWIGRGEPWKRADLFLDLVKKNPEAKFSMVLTKALHNQELFLKIKRRANQLKNLDYFEGMSNEKIYELMDKSKVLIFTSEKEGDWPMVVLEATAMGLPVLSYSLNYDYLIDDYGGGVFCKKDFQLFDSAFKDLLKDEKKYLKMSKAARKYSKEHHDLTVMAKKYLDIIKR